MRSVMPVLVDVEVEGPGPCVGRRSCGFFGWKSLFFSVRFISLIHFDGQSEREITRLHK